MIEVGIEGIQEATRIFGELAKRTSDTEPAMRQIAGIMWDSVEENFEVQGRPRWQPLSKARIRERTRKGTWPGKILTEFGQLATSIISKSSPESAVVSTNVKYAATQFLGDDTRNIPARNAMTLQPEDMAEIELRLLRHLLR